MTALEPPHPAGGLPPRDMDGLVTLLELSRDIGICSDLDTLLGRIEIAALRVIACDRITVFLGDRATNDLRSRLATGAGEIRTPADRGIAGATFMEGKAITVRDASADPRFYDEIDRQTGYRTHSLLSVPLRGIGGETIGVLELLNKRGGGFTEADEELASTLGSLTGITLQRQMLVDEYREKQHLEHDLQLARSIQQSLLPVANPRPHGYDVAGWSQAAAATGGDFYDYFDLPDGRLGLVVADVAGHGLAASLLACETRALIRSAAASTNSLADVVAHVNTLLYRDLRNERFVVLFLGALETLTGRLELVGAGCAPLVYRESEDGFTPTDSTVPPLGIFQAVPSPGVTVLTLRPGDVVVLATDGFAEWENDVEHPFGTERLAESVRRHARCPAAEIIRRLYQDVSGHASGVKQVDDLTALVIKRAI